MSEHFLMCCYFRESIYVQSENGIKVIDVKHFKPTKSQAILTFHIKYNVVLNVILRHKTNINNMSILHRKLTDNETKLKEN